MLAREVDKPRRIAVPAEILQRGIREGFVPTF
jgi:hypothetical protein